MAAFQQLARQPDRLAEAVQLYGGALLPSLDEEWRWFEWERLRTLYLNALQRLIQARRRERDYAAVLGYVQQVLAEDGTESVRYSSAPATPSRWTTRLASPSTPAPNRC